MKILTDVYFEAIALFAQIEGEDDHKFEMLNVAGEFSETNGVAEAAEEVTHREITVDQKRSIDMCIGGIYPPGPNHRRFFEEMLSVEEEHGDELGKRILDIAFTFVMAWTQRYGGLFQQIVVDGTGNLIDPGKLEPPR